MGATSPPLGRNHASDAASDNLYEHLTRFERDLVRPAGSPDPACCEREQDFLRIRRTSKYMILVQLFRRKSHNALAAYGVGISGGLY
jgi:hypothetical protein